MSNEWQALDLHGEDVGEQGANAIHAVATSDIPAAMARGAYPADTCRELIQRLFERRPRSSVDGRRGQPTLKS